MNTLNDLDPHEKHLLVALYKYDFMSRELSSKMSDQFIAKLTKFGMWDPEYLALTKHGRDEAACFLEYLDDQGDTGSGYDITDEP